MRLLFLSHAIFLRINFLFSSKKDEFLIKTGHYNSMNLMKLSDYVVDFLLKKNIHHVFIISGQGNLHLIDSLARHPEMYYVCMQHEQAAATAAEAYAKITGNCGAAIVTTGPGGTNTITGVACAWQDSVSVIYLSGQVNVNEMIGKRGVRQFGVQEINILDIVRPITKYSSVIDDPNTIKYHLEKAMHYATTGRPGPVWLDIPLSSQHAQINPDKLEGFTPESQKKEPLSFSDEIKKIVDLLQDAERPVILAGAGIKRARAQDLFRELINMLGFPILCTYSGSDLIDFEHPLFAGKPGVNGTRPGNFAIQNSDLLLILGSRLNTTITSSRPETFARAAKKIVIDIDPFELDKQWINADIRVNADVKSFLKELVTVLCSFKGKNIRSWVEKCQGWKKRYDPVLPEYFQQKDFVNSFVFIDTLSKALEEDDVIIHDMGTAFSCTMQAFKVKKGQFLSSNYGHAPMGYSISGLVGSWFGSKNKKRIVGIVGDGGLQMAIGELQTLIYYNIPVKLFIINNRSYLTIKHSQSTYFGGKFVDSTLESGYSVPDFLKIADAYGFSTASIKNHQDLFSAITNILSRSGQVMCDVSMSNTQLLVPKLAAIVKNGKYVTSPLEDMYPFLPRAEFLENMIIDPLPEQDFCD